MPDPAWGMLVSAPQNESFTASLSPALSDPCNLNANVTCGTLSLWDFFFFFKDIPY